MTHRTTRIPTFVQRLEEGLQQKISFYGTSLTEGGAWTGMLMDVLDCKYPGLVTSVNTALGGEHSVWGLANFQERVIAHQPDVLFLEFSVNDAAERFEISLEAARSNLLEMIEALQTARPDCEVVLQVMNPVLDRPEGHSGHRPHLAQYQQVWRDVAAAKGLLLIDHMPAWTALLERDEAAFRTLVPDGLHPAAEGYRQIVMPVLLPALHLQ